jgi:hypothetical protein
MVRRTGACPVPATMPMLRARQRGLAVHQNI